MDKVFEASVMAKLARAENACEGWLREALELKKENENLRQRVADRDEALLQMTTEIHKLRQQIHECDEFLKEGESLRDRMIRFGLDVQKGLLREAKLKMKLEALTKEDV